MTLNDLYAAQIEAHFYTLLMLGVCTTCICITRYICAKIEAEAISAQRIELVARPVPRLLESVTKRKLA